MYGCDLGHDGVGVGGFCGCGRVGENLVGLEGGGVDCSG